MRTGRTAGGTRIVLSAEETAAIDAEQQANREARDRVEYAERRRVEYPPVAEQLDAMWKGGEEAEAMRARIAEVKRRHPKPE